MRTKNCTDECKSNEGENNRAGEEIKTDGKKAAVCKKRIRFISLLCSTVGNSIIKVIHFINLLAVDVMVMDLSIKCSIFRI